MLCLIFCAVYILSQKRADTSADPLGESTSAIISESIAEVTSEDMSEIPENAPEEKKEAATEGIDFKYIVFYGDALDGGKQLFGTPAKVIIQNSVEKISVSYPETDISALDDEIQNFVSEVAEPGLEKTDLQSMNLPEDFVLKGEKRCVYESYLTGERFASVRFLLAQYTTISPNYVGEYSLSINYDIKTNRLLTLEDVIRSEKRAELFGLVAQKGGVFESSIDDKMLDVWVMTPEGIRFIISGMQYTCRADGEKAVFLSYEELSSMLTKELSEAVG